MAIDPGRVKALFQAAIERSDPGQRRAYLDREAGDDAELRGRLDALLDAHDAPPGVLDRPLDADPGATADAGPVSAPVVAPPRPPRPKPEGRPSATGGRRARLRSAR